MLDKIRYFLKRHYWSYATDVISLTDSNIRQIERSIFVIETLELKDSTWSSAESIGPLILEAPYPGIETTSFLPLPEFSDTEALLSVAKADAAMDGTFYSYSRKSERKRWTFTLLLSRSKALELYEFLEAYSGVEIRIRGWKGKVIQAVILNNPISFTYISKSSPTGMVEVPLEFEGVELEPFQEPTKISWTPESIPSLKIWLRSDRGPIKTPPGTPPSNGEQIEEWHDYRFNGTKFIMPTQGYRPSWFAGYNFPHVHSDGFDDYMSLVDPTPMQVGTGNFTLLFVVDSVQKQNLCRSSFFEYCILQQPDYAYYYWSNDLGFQWLAPMGSWKLMGLRRRGIGTDETDRINGHIMLPSTYSRSISCPYFDLFHSITGFGDISLAEMIFCDSAISNDDYDKLKYYITQRYGITHAKP